MNKIKLKKLDEKAQLPVYGTLHAAGADICACIDGPISIKPGEVVLIPTGISMELPNGYGAYLIPRSGLGHKNGIVLGNLIGLVDADYRGQVFVSLWNRNPTVVDMETDNEELCIMDKPFVVNPGDRIAQMCIIETRQFEFVWDDDLSETERGHGGFGHTGR